jgi:hypothetical protein
MTTPTSDLFYGLHDLAAFNRISPLSSPSSRTAEPCLSYVCLWMTNALESTIPAYDAMTMLRLSCLANSCHRCHEGHMERLPATRLCQHVLCTNAHLQYCPTVSRKITRSICCVRVFTAVVPHHSFKDCTVGRLYGNRGHLVSQGHPVGVTASKDGNSDT